jgi:NADH dehydrogenase
MKILVTGGTGVVGTGAIPALLGAGHEIRLLSRHAENEAGGFPAGVEPFAADIAEPEPLRDAVRGCEGVLHIAGIVEEQPPEVTFEKINVGGTRHVVAACAAAGESPPLLVFVSSLGADRGESDYHRSKRAAEALVHDYRGPWVILRPGSVYGPGDETISMLLKMLRTLPAVPVVDEGEQPFQPLWFEDFGRAVAQVFARPELAGRTLDLAGPDVTTTDDVLARLAELTGRNPGRLDVPAWAARVGAGALESFGAWGRTLMRRAGLGAPINSAKLEMLLEGSVIPERERNALGTTVCVELTPLQNGLEQLVDLLPEQLPGGGVGAVHHAVYAAEIRGSRFTAARLLDEICARITEVMPIDFAAEPDAPTQAEEGATLTAEIKGRGHVQVRIAERRETSVTLVTVEGHPLAGVVQVQTEDLPDGVRVAVHTFAQPANVVDWLAMKTVGEGLQRQNWREVVRRVITLSGGESPAGVQREAKALGDEEARDFEKWVERLAQRQRRAQREEQAARSTR